MHYVAARYVDLTCLRRTLRDPIREIHRDCRLRKRQADSDSGPGAAVANNCFRVYRAVTAAVRCRDIAFDVCPAMRFIDGRPLRCFLYEITRYQICR